MIKSLIKTPVDKTLKSDVALPNYVRKGWDVFHGEVTKMITTERRIKIAESPYRNSQEYRDGYDLIKWS